MKPKWDQIILIVAIGVFLIGMLFMVTAEEHLNCTEEGAMIGAGFLIATGLALYIFWSYKMDWGEDDE